MNIINKTLSLIKNKIVITPTYIWIMWLIGISILYLIFTFISLRMNTNDDLSSVIRNIHTQIEQQQQAHIIAALRQTFALFTIDDLINIKLVDKFHGEDEPKNFTEVNSLVTVILKDGNEITIGYFDSDGIYRSLLK